MPTPTDLRAALRAAAATLDACAELVSGFEPGTEPEVLAASCRALADAQPTVAELLPMVDATHEVHWTDEDGSEWRAVMADDDGGPTIAFEWQPAIRESDAWAIAYPRASFFACPGRLVEVSP